MAKKEIGIQTLCEELKREIYRWESVRKFGCNDPFWPDGTNMNLICNHIVSYKEQIKDYCTMHNCELPGEYFLPTPPEADQNYMAHTNQNERVDRLKQMGDKITTRTQPNISEQQSLF